MALELEYDDTGKTFYYFVLSVLSLYLIPATIFRFCGLFSKQDKDDDEDWRQTEKKVDISTPKKSKSWFTARNVIFVVCWLVFLFLLYKTTTFESERLYDPFEVLGLDHSASDREIKKKYRLLSLKYHPDKNLDNPEANSIFVRINKAYQALTDAATRENWEKYGNPDGPGATKYGIALPKWIVERENSAIVLGIYVLVFIIAIPAAVTVWWRRSKKYVKDEVMLKTVQFLIHFTSKNDSAKTMIETMSIAEEFEKQLAVRSRDQEALMELLREIPELPRNPWAGGKKGFRFAKLNYSIKARVLFHAHLQRLNVPEEFKEDMLVCLNMVPTLIQGLVDACSFRDRAWLKTVLTAMKLSQMFVQACPASEVEHPFLQVPHIENHLQHFTTKKRNIKSLRQLYSMPTSDIRDLLRGLEDDEFDAVIKFGQDFPFIRVNYDLKVQGDEGDEICCGDIVTLNVHLTRETMEDLQQAQANDAAAAQSKEPESNAPQAKKKPPGKGGKKKKGAKGGIKARKAARQAAEAPSSIEDHVKDAMQEDDEANEKPGTSSAASETGDNDVFDTEKDHDQEGAESDNGEDLDEIEGEDEDEEMDEEDLWGDFETEKKERIADIKKVESHPVFCPYFPLEKQEWWWVFLADRASDRMISLPPRKVMTLKDTTTVPMMFQAPLRPGKYSFTLYVVSDSYLGADIHVDVKFYVNEPRVHKEEEIIEEEIIEDSEESDEESDEEF